MKRGLLAALTLTACAPHPPVTPLPGVPTGACSTDRLGRLVGQAATLRLVNRARGQSGASMARVLRPGQIVTMEYREGRLNVTVDAAGRVTRFSCG